MKKKERTNNEEREKEIIAKNKEAKLVTWIVFTIILLLIVGISIGIYSGYSYVKSAFDPMDPESADEVHIEIPIGTSSSQIGDILEENGLIKDSRIFRYYLKFKNQANFQAGNYALSPTLTMEEIIEELQTGKVIVEPNYVITIPEGKNLEEIANIMAEKLTFSADEFLEVAIDEDFLRKLMEKFPNILTEDILNSDIYYPLEGYLFAGTYDIFEEEPTVETIIDTMVSRTNSIYNDNIDNIEDTGFNVHEILTLASVIERESKFSEDRPKVAQVYMNRLEQNMRLQSDITALYGLDHKAVMTYDDVNIESPYNTYVVDGLPVGPINSPSLESIQAVLQPEGEEFSQLFYFSRPTGETFYSETLDEHNQVISEYRHEWYELEESSDDEDDENEE